MTTSRSSPHPSELVDATFDRWLPGAMFPSETMWLEQNIRASGAEIVIECGRQDGVSTWTLATLLRDTDVHILSIDFDEDRSRRERVEATLEGLPVTCVSGDIHVQVPTLIRAHRGSTIAVVQDGPKGWEGMATLMACAYEPDVTLLAQHNLHIGHVSRTAFQMLSLRPAFLEVAAAGDPFLTALRAREVDELARRDPNRPVDHTSLGIIELDEPARSHLLEVLPAIRRITAPWDPAIVADHWRRGDFEHCSRLRSRARFTRTRFKPR